MTPCSPPTTIFSRRIFYVIAAVLAVALRAHAGDFPGKTMNSVFVIASYRYHGSWVFDDPAVGLTREPFIAGIDTMIDRLVADIPNAGAGFRAIFSASPFPGASVKLVWLRAESGGNWYHCEQYGTDGWLCPALGKYFPAAPREIYVKAEPKR